MGQLTQKGDATGEEFRPVVDHSAGAQLGSEGDALKPGFRSLQFWNGVGENVANGSVRLAIPLSNVTVILYRFEVEALHYYRVVAPLSSRIHFS